MDKVAFIAATRHGRVDFVTASCERIDFAAPAHLGEIVELTGRVVRVGRRSLSAEVELLAEPLSGERRLCSRGTFNMVAVGGATLPPIAGPPPELDGDFRMTELVFPEQTSHYGILHGGQALTAMGKAAFVVATRHARKTVVMASVRKVDFIAPVRSGELIELLPRIEAIGRTSLTVPVELWSEHLRTGKRCRCGFGAFTMVAVDGAGRPAP
jgi:acyl-CoA hydrolase